MAKGIRRKWRWTDLQNFRSRQVRYVLSQLLHFFVASDTQLTCFIEGRRTALGIYFFFLFSIFVFPLD